MNPYISRHWSALIVLLHLGYELYIFVHIILEISLIRSPFISQSLEIRKIECTIIGFWALIEIMAEIVKLSIVKLTLIS